MIIGFTYCYHFPALAAILGMYTLMSNKQYYDALGTTGTIANTEGINSTFDLITQLVSSIFSRWWKLTPSFSLIFIYCVYFLPLFYTSLFSTLFAKCSCTDMCVYIHDTPSVLKRSAGRLLLVWFNLDIAACESRCWVLDRCGKTRSVQDLPRRAAQPHQRGGDSGENPQQRQQPDWSQPQQHQGALDKEQPDSSNANRAS